MIKDIMKTIDKRRSQLRSVLESRKDELDLGKQHQMYGAINELDLVMRTLQYHHDEWVKQCQDVRDLSHERQRDVDKRFDDQMMSLRQQPFSRLPDENPMDEEL